MSDLRDEAIEAIKERLNSTYADEDTWQQVMAEAALDGLIGWLRRGSVGLSYNLPCYALTAEVPEQWSYIHDLADLLSEADDE